MRRTDAPRAVIIGGSVAGLLAARVLAKYFDEVVLVERDDVSSCPEVRKGQPHAWHQHVLLSAGYEHLKRWFPGIDAEMAAEGAIIGDIGRLIKWHQFGQVKIPIDSGIECVMASRPFIECHIRARVLALPNVRLLQGHEVTGLVTTSTGGTVSGVRTRARNHPTCAGTVIDADLVVDSSGRSGAPLRRLEELGYPRPQETRVRVDVTYASRYYRRAPGAPAGVSGIYCGFSAPSESGATLLAVEGDRWIVSTGSVHGSEAPADAEGFARFLRNLPTREIYDVVSDCEPISDVGRYQFRFSLRRHYEDLLRFPSGLIVLGDSLASFNPVYGQGMSVAAQTAEILDQLLESRGPAPNLWKEYFRRAARAIDGPWQMAVGEDFRWSQTQGQKPFATDLINGYTERLHRVMSYDENSYRQFLRVINLVDPPSFLLRPQMLWAVLRSTVGTLNQVRATPGR
jgi:2-polyprenyl-6-methoxyphenol hydroxylase-like FAD-dependent oxidoreductase